MEKAWENVWQDVLTKLTALINLGRKCWPDRPEYEFMEDMLKFSRADFEEALNMQEAKDGSDAQTKEGAS